MIITIGGDIGSGKSTLVKKLANKLNYKQYSTGDFFRAEAQKRGMTVLEFNHFCEQNPGIDEKIIDARQENLGKIEDNFIIDGRLAWFFIPHSFKIYLKVDGKVAAERILADQRDSEEDYSGITELVAKMVARKKSEQKRYLGKYQADMLKMENYDLVVNTNGLTREEVFAKVMEEIEKKC